ncbi:MAG: chorismate mutase [Deltaproteobacteria bacterium]|nr:chorismate mutase [Deltaproteobacteria bacterium]
MTITSLSDNPFIKDKRESIDLLDHAFLILLSEKLRLVEKIIFLKHQSEQDVFPGEERKKDLNRILELSVELDLQKEFFEKILHLVLQGAVEQFERGYSDDQTEIMRQVCGGLALKDLRENLYNLDQSLCLILSERFRAVKLIGKLKKSKNIAPLDPDRWKIVLENKVRSASNLGIPKKLVEEIYNAIHEAALDIEAKVERF